MNRADTLSAIMHQLDGHAQFELDALLEYLLKIAQAQREALDEQCKDAFS